MSHQVAMLMTIKEQDKLPEEPGSKLPGLSLELKQKSDYLPSVNYF